MMCYFAGNVGHLHTAVIPGFCLKWDREGLCQAIVPRYDSWTDPADWTDIVVPMASDLGLRGFEEADQRIGAK